MVPILLAGAGRADLVSSQPITLQRALLWAGSNVISESQSDLGFAGAAAYHTMGGAELTFSALANLWKQDGPVRVGDLVGVTVGGGDRSRNGSHLLVGLIDARVGAQMLFVFPKLEIGVEGGLSSGAIFDQLSDSREFEPFAGARLRYGPLLVEGGFLRGPLGAASISLGPVRAGAQVHHYSAQDRYSFGGTASDHWTVSGTEIRAFVSRDF